MSDDEANDADIKSFGFDDSGSDFSIGCYGADGNRYPMEELDEWDQDEVCIFIQHILSFILSYCTFTERFYCQGEELWVGCRTM